MHLFSTLLFTLSANIDNFTVGIAYGVKKIRIGLFSNILIATISCIGTFLSMSIGTFISKLIPLNISNILGSLILISIGLWFIKDFIVKSTFDSKPCLSTNKEFNKYIEILDDPCKADIDNSGSIDIKESISLAFALTINNFGLGIGARITGLNIILTTSFIFVFSLLTIILGYYFGKSYLSIYLGKYAPLLAGIIIVILGTYEILI